MVTAGVAITVVPEVVFKPIDGDQLTLVTVVGKVGGEATATNEVDSPAQIVVSLRTVTVGLGFGVMFTENVKVFCPNNGQALSLTVTVNTCDPISENLGFQQKVPTTVSAVVFCVLKEAPGTAPFHVMKTESAGSISVPSISKHSSCPKQEVIE